MALRLMAALLNATTTILLILWRRTLVSTALLAYTLGLRHALDADHISVLLTASYLQLGQCKLSSPIRLSIS